jgi:hypothetical protein
VPVGALLADDLDIGGGGAGFALMYGGVSEFTGGLTRLVGPPATGDVLAAMHAEHCEREDARTQFEVGNYGTTTTSTAVLPSPPLKPCGSCA